MIKFALFAGVIVLQVWYWGFYFPRAWKKPGTHREIDAIRAYVEFLRGRQPS